jgi:hypothetical protein
LSWLIWAVLFAAFQSAADQIGFEYNINLYALWPILGQPRDIFSFKNLAGPKLMVFIATSVPSTFGGLLVFSAFSSRRRRWYAAIVALIAAASCVFSMIARQVQARATVEQRFPDPRFSAVFGLFLASAAVLLGWALNKVIPEKRG